MNVEILALAIVVSIICTSLLRRLHQWVVRFSHRMANDVFPFLFKLDMEALYGTFHPDPEKGFRNSLSSQEFKRIQWKRIHLAIHYCNQIVNNAQVLLSWTRYEREQTWLDKHPGIKKTAQELRIACLQSTLSAFVIKTRLRWWLVRMALLPFAPPPTFATLVNLGSWEMISFYETVTTLAEVFSLAYGEEYHEKLMQAL
jgi:hypothetical protein